MNFPIKLKIINLFTKEERKGLAVLKNSPFCPPWKDVVVLSNNDELCGGTFKGEQGFKFAYDFFTWYEKTSVEDLMKRIYNDCLRYKNLKIIAIREKKFKEIKL